MSNVTYRGFLAGAALCLGGLAAAIVVHGGWQAAAAAVAILGGMLFLVIFISLQIARERPAPDWLHAEAPARRASEPVAEQAPSPKDPRPKALVERRARPPRARHAGA
jgi:hypothetical protein